MKETRSLGPPWASSLSRTRTLPPCSRAVLCCPGPPFKMAPLPPARCPPITLIGGAKGMLSVAGWWVGVVYPVPHGPSGPSRPRFTWRDATTHTHTHTHTHAHTHTHTHTCLSLALDGAPPLCVSCALLLTHSDSGIALASHLAQLGESSALGFCLSPLSSTFW